MAKKKRALPEINAGSMADIAFLLLIFFLVTTTIDTDKGIALRLPPLPEDEQEQQSNVKERNVLKILVNRFDDLLVEGERTDIKQLKRITKEFIDNPYKKEEYAEAPQKAIISLKNDRGTSYSLYLSVHNELKAAYNELRNEMAMRDFGKKYDDLDKDKQKIIQNYYKQVISEAEPENIGGN